MSGRKGASTRAEGLNGKAYALLRDAILAGQLPPGTPLSRRRLAEEFAMSTLPVADALVRLETEGFVESRPRAGTRVKIPSAAEVDGTIIVREALETHSARLFAERASAADRRLVLSRATDLDRRFQALGRTAKPDRVRHAAAERLHLEFHMLVATATQCPELAAAIERSRVLLLNWLFNCATSEYVPLPVRWHRDLAEALVNGAPGEAAEAMRFHVRYRKEVITAAFERLFIADRTNRRVVRGPQRGRRTGGGGITQRVAVPGL